MDKHLINIGFNNTVAVDQIVVIVSPNSAPMKRLKDEAREKNLLVDATHGRKTRSIIVTTGNHVILSSVQPETVSQRFEAVKNSLKDKPKPICTPGLLFIVSAPSGAGKTTLCKTVRERFQDIRYSVSYTTRAPRGGETDGKDYFFITNQEFQNGVDTGRWAEWAEVHGNLYATSAEFIDRTMASGYDVLLAIDVQGMEKIIKKYPESITIFIMPPSMDILAKRLKARNTDSEQALKIRLTNAENEIAAKDKYRHVLVNDRLPQAGAELATIIATHRAERSDVLQLP